MAAKKSAKPKKEKAPRFVKKTPRELAALVGADAEILVSALSLRTILQSRADKKIEGAIAASPP